jgi:hypothetical protein
MSTWLTNTTEFLIARFTNWLWITEITFSRSLKLLFAYKTKLYISYCWIILLNLWFCIGSITSGAAFLITIQFIAIRAYPFIFYFFRILTHKTFVWIDSSKILVSTRTLPFIYHCIVTFCRWYCFLLISVKLTALAKSLIFNI